MVVANAAVSKQHCQLRWDGRQIEVSDLGSTNGTFLGEERLESGRWYPWQPNAPLRIGPYAIQLD
jgi:pSer/pThr/pTyr-binding forkhead associated (FHA) protein